MLYYYSYIVFTIYHIYLQLLIYKLVQTRIHAFVQNKLQKNMVSRFLYLPDRSPIEYFFPPRKGSLEPITTEML